MDATESSSFVAPTYKTHSWIMNIGSTQSRLISIHFSSLAGKRPLHRRAEDRWACEGVGAWACMGLMGRALRTPSDQARSFRIQTKTEFLFSVREAGRCAMHTDKLDYVFLRHDTSSPRFPLLAREQGKMTEPRRKFWAIRGPKNKLRSVYAVADAAWCGYLHARASQSETPSMA